MRGMTVDRASFAEADQLEAGGFNPLGGK